MVGTVEILHCCNYDSFLRRSADVFPQDGKNLNRVFPGSVTGSVTEQTAAFLEEAFIQKSDYIVDLHSGGFCETQKMNFWEKSVIFTANCRSEFLQKRRALFSIRPSPWELRREHR